MNEYSWKFLERGRCMAQGQMRSDFGVDPDFFRIIFQDSLIAITGYFAVYLRFWEFLFLDMDHDPCPEIF